MSNSAPASDRDRLFAGAAARRPLLIVLSAPSGAGKTTLCRSWLGRSRNLVASVSCTTRKPRAGETPGACYHFLSDADFTGRIAKGDFLEHALVHQNRYGTLRETVLEALSRQDDIVLTIDVQGADAVRRQALAPDAHPLIRNGYVDIFVVPPSFEVLRQRLTGRGTDAREVIETRLRNAESEMARWRQYRYVVVNDDLEEAVSRLQAIRLAEQCRVCGP